MTQVQVATRFDYRAACIEVALPILNRTVRCSRPAALALLIYRELRDAPEFDKLAQGRDLDVPMPESLAPRFQLVPTGDLCLMARTIHNVGHWSGTVDEGVPDKRGAYWKFSNLADQELRRRLKLGNRQTPHGHGWHFEVHEGCLRACASAPDSWTWIEVGPATIEVLARAKAYVYKLALPPPVGFRSRPQWEAFERAAWDFTSPKRLPEELQLMEHWRALLEIGVNYTRPETECTDSCRECGKEARPYSDALLSHSTKCSKFQIPFQLGQASNALKALAAECSKQGRDPGPANMALQMLQEYTAK